MKKNLQYWGIVQFLIFLSAFISQQDELNGYFWKPELSSQPANSSSFYFYIFYIFYNLFFLYLKIVELFYTYG